MKKPPSKLERKAALRWLQGASHEETRNLLGISHLPNTANYLYRIAVVIRELYREGRIVSK